MNPRESRRPSVRPSVRPFLLRRVPPSRSSPSLQLYMQWRRLSLLHPLPHPLRLPLQLSLSLALSLTAAIHLDKEEPPNLLSLFSGWVGRGPSARLASRLSLFPLWQATDREDPLSKTEEGDSVAPPSFPRSRSLSSCLLLLLLPVSRFELRFFGERKNASSSPPSFHAPLPSDVRERPLRPLFFPRRPLSLCILSSFADATTPERAVTEEEDGGRPPSPSPGVEASGPPGTKTRLLPPFLQAPLSVPPPVRRRRRQRRRRYPSCSTEWASKAPKKRAGERVGGFFF